jgi:hypothetical protein
MRWWKANYSVLWVLSTAFLFWAVLETRTLAQDNYDPVPAAGERPSERQLVYTTNRGNGVVWPNHQKETEAIFDASVVIQVDGGTGGQLTAPATAILTTSAIVERAAKAAFQFEPAKVREALQISASYPGLRMTRLEVRLLQAPGVEWKEGDAEKLVYALTDALRAALGESTDAVIRANTAATKQWQKELEESSAMLAEIRTQQKAIRDGLRNVPLQYHDPSVGARNATNQLNMLDQQIRQVDEQLARIDPGPMALLEEWEQLVKLREEKLRQLKEENRGTAELKDAQIQLAEDRAKLESIRSGSDRSTRSSISEAARLKARVESLHQQRDELTAGLAKLESPEVQTLLDKQQQLAADEQKLRRAITQANSRIDHYPRQQPERFVVTILDGEAD